MAGPIDSSAYSATPLGSLPLVAIDLETTGLDVRTERVVQLGAVRIVSSEIDPADGFDALVRPDIAIPASATAIHGIGDSDVAGAEPFPAIRDRFAEWAAESILIGWAVGFDLAVLQAEHRRHGLSWNPPRALDVRRLVQALSPNLPELSLETVAAWLGLPVVGRHTATGDALLTAKIYIALLPRLRDRGILTLTQAERACRAQTQLAEEEARAGWLDIDVSADGGGEDVADFARIDSYPYTHRLRDVMQIPPVFLDDGATLEQALGLMMARQVSSVFLPPSPEDGRYGILTERDVLRAIDSDKGQALARPATDFATRPLYMLAENEFVYRAMGAMTRRGFRHVGVTSRDGEPAGAISARDLLRERTGAAASLGDTIEEADDAAALGRIWPMLSGVARGLVREGVGSREVASVVSRELRALTRQACVIAERSLRDEGLGEPPSHYAFLVLGSGGRGESLLAMDQDNALIYQADAPDSDADGWFERLGRRVSDILDEVGVVYCSGGVMAANAAWRRDASSWRGLIDGWLRKSRPEDILSADIFFDFVPVYGEAALADELRRHALSAAGRARSFLQALTINAGNFRTPLGLMGRLRTENGRVDLKIGGIMPIFSAARVLALRHGLPDRSTRRRLEAARDAGHADADVVDNLLEAHEILLEAILRQQLRDLDAGEKLSNRVAPSQMTAHDRDQLRWALHQAPSVRDLLGAPLFGP